MPSKSIPQKSNHDFKEKYPYIPAGTLEPMSTKVILTKTRSFCCKIHNDIKFGKEVKVIINVDISLHSLKCEVDAFINNCIRLL